MKTLMKNHRPSLLLILPILLLLPMLAYQACNEGCLKCSSRNQCLVCDIEHFYYLSNGYCQYFRPDFCLFALQSNECLVCKQGFYLDRGACERTNQIYPNCLQANFKDCVLCETGYYLYKGVCHLATTPITNCKVQSNSLQCKKCTKGYQLSTNQTQCDALSSQTHSRHCALVSNLDCHSYHHSYSLWNSFNALNNHSFKDKILLKLLRRAEDHHKVNAQNVYQQIVLARHEQMPQVSLLGDTLEFKRIFDSDASSQCDLFLTDNQFYNLDHATLLSSAPPVDSSLTSFAEKIMELIEHIDYFSKFKICKADFAIKIENCKLYKNDFQCRECDDMFYLENNECKPQPVIDNCLQYSKSQNNVCESCEDGFYSDSNLCKARATLIPDCKALDPFQEQCLECTPNHQLHTNKTQCLKLPKNCQSLDPVTSTCTTCKPHFYKDSSHFCFFPNKKVPHCLIYKDLFTCQTCELGFQLLNNSCQPFNIFSFLKANCQLTSTIQGKPTCTQCAQGHLPIKLKNNCVPLQNTIHRCKKYDSNGLCQECRSKFFLLNNQCLAVSEPNCEINHLSKDICLKCEYNIDFKVPSNLHTGNTCVGLQNILKQDCAQFQLNLNQSQFPCSKCFAPFLPVEVKNNTQSFCLAGFQIPDLSEHLKSYCDIIELENYSVKSCRRCKFDESLKSHQRILGTRCVNECPKETYIVATYTRKNKIWFQCIERSLVSLTSCSNCSCARFDSAHLVSSFYDDLALDPATKYTHTQMRDLIDSVIANEASPEDHHTCMQCPPGSLPVINSKVTVSSQNAFSKYDFKPTRFIKFLPNKSESYFSHFNFIPRVKECAPYGIDSISTLLENPAATVKDIYNIYLKVDFGLFFSTQNNVTLNNFELCKAVHKGPNKVGCASCVFGYNGYIFNSSDEKINFLSECFFFFDCKPEVYNLGITSESEHGDLHFHVSCHQCKNPDELISFLTFPVNSESFYIGGDPTKFDISLTTVSKNFCKPPGIFLNNPNFPAHCAIQEVISILFKDFDAADTDNINPVCRVCKPGYKPEYYTRTTDSKKYVKSCTKITNCHSSDHFNRCALCSPGYALKREASHPGLSLQQDCIQNDITNCHIASKQTDCLKCHDGYLLKTLNGKPHCLKQKNYYCGTHLTQRDGPLDLGCKSCFNGFHLGNFNYDTLSMCYEAPHQLTSNCKSFNHQFKCETCLAGHYPVAGEPHCVAPSINFCAEYNPNSTCARCRIGYYLDAPDCKKGQINHCFEYADARNCKACDTNYHIYKTTDGTACVQVQELFPDCLSFSIDNTSFPPVAQCDLCSDYTIAQDFTPITLCKRYEEQKLCATFDHSNSQPDSGSPVLPVCSQCQKQAFLIDSPHLISTKSCIERLNYPIYQCETYDPAVDTCLHCRKGFFLSRDQVSCIQLRFGIKNCLFYSFDGKCKICQTGFSLGTDKASCLAVSTPMVNCLYQETDSKCLACNHDFVLKADWTCEAQDLTNEAHRETLCLKMISDFSLKGSLLRIRLLLSNCFVALEENCHSFTKTGECHICEDEFYLDSFGQCLPVETTIPNCQFYHGPHTCRVCDTGFLLSDHAEHCLRGTHSSQLSHYQHCAQLFKREYCILCDPGHKMSPETGECGHTYLGDECQTIDFDGKCLLCASGYQMDTAYKCSQNLEIKVHQESIKMREE